MSNAKRWILVAAIAAIPLATTSCKIPLANGCTYEIIEPHTWGDIEPGDLSNIQRTTYHSGEVC